MILVTGATGHVGAEVVRLLAESGEPVLALSRHADAAELPNGVRAMSADLNDPDSVAPALPGTRGMFVLSGYRNLPQLLDQAAAAGVQQIVLLSGSSATARDVDNAISRYMLDAERAVRECRLAWTILRPVSFMSNTLSWADQVRAGDEVRAPFGDVPVATVDPLDIAAVAAEALLSGGHDGRIYPVTGPESLTPADRVRVLGEVLGRDLRFRGQADDEARAEMSAAMPGEYVHAFFRFFADGMLDESPVLETVAEVTGRPPRTFRQWAQAHADAFRTG